jgi:hypothetical protein
MMLESNELSWARGYIEDNMLPGTAIINRDGGTVNSYYEYNPDKSANGTVSCRIDPYNKQDSKQVVGERDASRNWYRLTLPNDVDVQSDDTITIAGTDYSIIQLHEGHSDNFTVRLIIAKVE